MVRQYGATADVQLALARPLALPWRTLIHAAAYVALAVVGWTIFAADSGGDAHAYWTARGYGATVDERDAFLYSPVFLRAMWPVQQLPWEAFRLLFLTAQLGALVWMTGPIIAVLVILPGAWSPVYTDLYFGNIGVLTGAIAVAGLRYPALWAALPFTKVLPGVILLWPTLRRQWRPILLVIGVGTVSVLLEPTLWLAWVETLMASSEHPPANGLSGAMMLRAAVAAGMIGLGAWRRWPWLIPPAMVLAQPVLWYSSFAILLGWFRLLRQRAPTSSPRTT